MDEPEPRRISAFLHVRRDEAGWVGSLFLLFFCIIFVFWCLKPLRTSGVVKAYGPDWYPLFKQGTALLMPFAVWAYSALSDRLRRERLFLGVLGTFFALTVGFWGLLRGSRAEWPNVLFFFYVDSYATVSVAMFWSYLNDVSTPAQARRLYGVIGAGGIAGGMAGAATSGWLTQRLGPDLLLLTLPFFAAAAVLVHKSARTLHPSAGKPRAEGPRVHDALAGARMVVGSPYLIAIAGMVGLYELVSTNLDYVFTTMADANFPSRDAMAAYQGRVFFWANLGALVMQVGFVSWIHQRLGVKAGLLVLPLILLVGSAMFAAEPMLVVISGVIGADGALSYSVNQSSKEVLYTPTDRDTTYKAKAFIDMFIFRSAKAVGGAFLLFYAFRLTHLGFGMSFLATVNVGLAAVWIGLVWVADRHYRRLEGLAPAA